MTMTKSEKTELAQLNQALLVANEKILSLELANRQLLETINDDVTQEQPINPYRFELVKAQMSCKQIPISNSRPFINDMIKIADETLETLSE